jgi:hypothetical protein
MPVFDCNEEGFEMRASQMEFSIVMVWGPLGSSLVVADVL